MDFPRRFNRRRTLYPAVRKKQGQPQTNRQRAALLLLVMLSSAAIFLAAAVLFLLEPGEIKSGLAEAFLLRATSTPTPAPTRTPSAVPVRTAAPAVKTPAPTAAPTPAEGPEILIYHTHATEAYRQCDGYTYEPSGNCRTEEQDKSVVAVGEALAKTLEDVYGYSVVRDTTNHEPPRLATAYSRSEKTMLAYLDRYPTLRYFIDAHRDAYGKSASGTEDFVKLGGEECARVMFVVGTGKGATGTGFDEMPDFEGNFAFAQAVTSYLQSINTKLAREVRIKTGRYNQHIPGRCMLIEFGHNANTLPQAIASVPYVAEAVNAAIKNGTDNAVPGGTDVWTPED